jgi:hypothetical protein
MKIYDVRHGNGADKNGFCGPSAVSALTGMSSGEAARLLRHVTGKRSIKGTSTGAVRRALNMCGIQLVMRKTRLKFFINKKGERVAQGEDSVAAWLKRTVADRTPGRVFLLVAGNHWQVISGRRYVCGISGEVVSITDKKVKRRAKVTEVWECLAPGSITIPAAAKKTKDWVDRQKTEAYSNFRKFAREKGLQYSIYPESGLNYITVMPTSFWPDGLETLHYDFCETLGRLEACYENPALVEDGYYSE